LGRDNLQSGRGGRVTAPAAGRRAGLSGAWAVRSRGAPRDPARASDSSVSAVLPDWLSATTRVPASSGGLLPQQIWDSADIPDRELYLGRPSGSAMPLVWAHAEHIKLLRSLRDGAIFDMPRHTYERYIKGKPLPVYGDGLNVRDWLYVGDHCSAIATVLGGGQPDRALRQRRDARRDLPAAVAPLLSGRIWRSSTLPSTRGNAS